MNFKTALLLTLFAPMASHAFMRAPIQLPTEAVDCGNRSNSFGSQTSELQGLLHRVALVGPESGREVSNDPNTQEAQSAESTGQAVACGKSSGVLNLVEYNGKTVLVGAAHAFYKDGSLKCDQGFGEFYPDDHYYTNPGSGIVFNRSYRFKLPPLNHEAAYKGTDLGINSSENLKDFVILEIEDESLLDRQLGGKRATIVMENTATSQLNSLSNSEEISLVSTRKNFHAKMKVSYESGCQVLSVSGNERLKQHTCDTGQGSSGSSLNYTDQTGQIKSLGIHYGSVGNRNFFVPSENIIDALDGIYPIESNTSEETTPISI